MLASICGLPFVFVDLLRRRLKKDPYEVSVWIQSFYFVGKNEINYKKMTGSETEIDLA